MNIEKKLIKRKLSEIVFDEGLYPRIKGHDPEVVQTYARDLEEIEESEKFISLNLNNVLIDGKHRFLAYKKRNEGNLEIEVPVFQYQISSDIETYRLACSLQDKGKALSNEDRQSSAKRLYALGDQSQKDIAKALGVAQPTVSKWLSQTLKEEKERKREKALAMWLACANQEEIAEAIEVNQSSISKIEDEFMKIFQENKFINSSDFEPPIYNIWTTNKKSNAVSHFGNSEPRWLENLLYLYTEPAGIVVDPFAGSGSTIDVCKKRGRRYFVSDRKPIVEREHEIRLHDLIDKEGNVQMPAVPRWKDVELVYLDPPYWRQAEGQYSQDAEDLGNMTIERFNQSLAGIINAFAKKLRNGKKRFIALIIQPTQWRADDRVFTDHVGDMLRVVKLPVNMRFSVPYQTEQYNAQMVQWAKENRRCLVLTREVVVWEVN